MGAIGRSRFSSLVKAVGDELSKTMLPVAKLLQTEAQISITTGAVSGKGHVPSRPGQPPNNDTGLLAGHIEAVQTGPLSSRVTSNAPYAVSLEYGTSKIAERPYMRPAAVKTRDEIKTALAAAVTRGVRKGMGK